MMAGQGILATGQVRLSFNLPEQLQVWLRWLPCQSFMSTGHGHTVRLDQFT